MSEDGDQPGCIALFEARSLLTSVIGYSDILASKSFGELNDRQREFLEEILKAVKGLLEIVDGCDGARTEGGFAAAVDAAVRAVRSLAISKKLTIEFAIADGIVVKKPDVGPVLTALLFNAVGSSASEATVEMECWTGGGLLHIRTEHTNEFFECLELSLARAKISVGTRAA
jgi:signal transduction histidine kinase